MSSISILISRWIVCLWPHSLFAQSPKDRVPQGGWHANSKVLSYVVKRLSLMCKNPALINSMIWDQHSCSDLLPFQEWEQTSSSVIDATTAAPAVQGDRWVWNFSTSFLLWPETNKFLPCIRSLLPMLNKLTCFSLFEAMLNALIAAGPIFPLDTARYIYMYIS